VQSPRCCKFDVVVLVRVVLLLIYLLNIIVLSLQYQAKRFAGKNVSNMSYSVSSGE